MTEISILREFPADPGGRIQDLTDALPLHVARHQVGVVQQSGHLRNSKDPDGFDPNGHVQHLGGNEVAMPCAL